MFEIEYEVKNKKYLGLQNHPETQKPLFPVHFAHLEA
jgi:hypothetical protein